MAGNIGNAIPPDDFRDAAMIGLDAVQRANSTLEDFVSNIILFCWYRSQSKPKKKKTITFMISNPTDEVLFDVS